MTQEELGELANLSAIYIGTIENGKRDPSLSTVCSLARGLGVFTGAFFGATSDLGPVGLKTARFFDSVEEDVQHAVLALLYAVTKH